MRVHLVDGDLEDGPAAAPLVEAAIDRGEVVKTSPPTPADYLLAIEQAGATGALIVTPPAEFTVMHRNALVAVRHASVPVEVVDARTAAAGQGLVAAAALRALDRGADLAGARAAAVDATSRVTLAAAIESVEVVGRTGRVPAEVITTPARLGSQAIFRLEAGRVVPAGAAANATDAIRQLAAAWTGEGGPDAEETVVLHAGRDADAHTLAQRLDGRPRVAPFSSAMAVHTGLGVVGLAWLRR